MQTALPVFVGNVVIRLISFMDRKLPTNHGNVSDSFYYPSLLKKC